MKAALKPRGKKGYGLKMTVKKELNKGAIINANHSKNKEVDTFLKNFDLKKFLRTL